MAQNWNEPAFGDDQADAAAGREVEGPTPQMQPSPTQKKPGAANINESLPQLPGPQPVAPGVGTPDPLAFGVQQTPQAGTGMGDAPRFFGGTQPILRQPPEQGGGLPQGSAAPTPTPTPSVFNYNDPQGNPQTAASASAVPGQVGYESAPLIDGGTRTAGATATNAFEGYRSADGGGFGGYNASTDPANTAAGVAKNLAPVDWTQVRPEDLQSLAAKRQNENGAMVDGTEGIIAKLNSGQSLTPAEQAYYELASGKQGPYRISQDSSGNPVANWSPNDAMALGLNQQGGALDASADYYARQVAAGGMTQEQADFWRNRAASGTTEPGASPPASPGGVYGAVPPVTTTEQSSSGPPPSLPGAQAVGSSGQGGAGGVQPNTGVGVGTGDYQTTAENALTNQTIGAPAQNDPYKMAQDEWANFQRATDPQYQANLRDAKRVGAAAGGLGSGQLRTSLGDLLNQRNLQLDTQRSDLLSRALGQQNENAYRNVGIKQQQQGFQRGQQQDAFQNAITGTMTQDALKQSEFGRALQRMLTGSQGDPSSAYQTLSAILGQQGSAAGQSLAELLSGMYANRPGSPAGTTTPGIPGATTNTPGANSNPTDATAFLDWMKTQGRVPSIPEVPMPPMNNDPFGWGSVLPTGKSDGYNPPPGAFGIGSSGASSPQPGPNSTPARPTTMMGGREVPVDSLPQTPPSVTMPMGSTTRSYWDAIQAARPGGGF